MLVEFVDYGNVYKTDKKMLRHPLDHKLFKLPSQVIWQCRLAATMSGAQDVRSCGGFSVQNAGTWFKSSYNSPKLKRAVLH